MNLFKATTPFAVTVATLALTYSQPAQAATWPACPSGAVCIQVTGQTAGTHCTLDDAITVLQNQSTVGRCTYRSGANTILLPLISGSSTTYTVNWTQYLPGRIIGMGVNRTILSFPGSSGGFQLFGDATTGLEHLTVRSTNTNNRQTGVYVASQTTAVLSNIKVSGFKHHGIFNEGYLTVSSSTISDNSADAYGGGLHNSRFSEAEVWMSTINNNSAPAGGGVYEAGNMRMAYSTVANNHAYNEQGGGVYIASGDGNPSWRGWHVTVFNNTATSRGIGMCGLGAGVFADTSEGPSSVDWNASIFASNLSINGNPSDYVGPIHTSSNITDGANRNVMSHVPADCVPGNWGTYRAFDGRTNTSTRLTDFQASTQALFGTNRLASNGGPTQTVALAAGSPAINAGQNTEFNTNSSSVPKFKDQRGSTAPAPAGSRYDLGAYERN